MQSRRTFLGRVGAGAAGWSALGGVSTAGARGAAIEDPDRLAALAALALERAKAVGASYADIRINRYRSQFVTFRAQADMMTGKELEVPSVSDTESFGFGLRVLAEG